MYIPSRESIPGRQVSKYKHPEAGTRKPVWLEWKVGRVVGEGIREEMGARLSRDL